MIARNQWNISGEEVNDSSSIDVYVLAHSNDLEYWPNDLDLPH